MVSIYNVSNHRKILGVIVVVIVW